MNRNFIKFGLDSGMLNYVDHETPRQYFLHHLADEECLNKFAELIVRECVDICEKGTATQTTSGGAAILIKQHFGFDHYRNN